MERHLLSMPENLYLPTLSFTNCFRADMLVMHCIISLSVWMKVMPFSAKGATKCCWFLMILQCCPSQRVKTAMLAKTLERDTVTIVSSSSIWHLPVISVFYSLFFSAMSTNVKALVTMDLSKKWVKGLVITVQHVLCVCNSCPTSFLSFFPFAVTGFYICCVLS